MNLLKKIGISNGVCPTNEEIVAQCNELAIRFCRYYYPVSSDYKVYESTNDFEYNMWLLAVIAYDHFGDFDINEALDHIGQDRD